MAITMATIMCITIITTITITTIWKEHSKLRNDSLNKEDKNKGENSSARMIC
ncbi:hypothetical protein [Paenibacillus ihumii]|uniref:hypothetical protein n=1 Tax=Paenibacillus ihumii TaxID=687436 RepID=UPI001CA35A87|nr:hypothetical protein [Paenibacillus ihumii]